MSTSYMSAYELLLLRKNASNKHKRNILYTSSLSNWLTNELKKKNEESRKKIRALDKNHGKEFKGVRSRICSRIENIDKMRRKLKGHKQTEVRIGSGLGAVNKSQQNL